MARSAKPAGALASLTGAGLAVASLAAGVAAAAPGSIVSEPPARPDKNARYLFYLHGLIIENAGRRPTHPRFGVYEYDAVLEALASHGAVVISEQRPKGTAAAAYAKKVAAQVQALLAAGVPASHVAVVGFSKGGAIARAVSAAVKADVRYVILAGCFGEAAQAKLHGKVLSIREKSDHVAGSCQHLLERSTETSAQRELVIDIGGEHGAFYRPHDAWLEPLRAWVGD